MSGIVLAYGKAEQNEINHMLSTLSHRGKRRKVKVDSGVGIGLISSDEPPRDQVALDGHVCWMEQDGKDRLISGEELYLRYLRYGTKCLDRLNGAFAFAIAQGGKLFVACDPFGQKVLYYGVYKGTLYFASEIKALVGVVPRIKVVPGGHYFHTDEGWNRYFPTPPDTVLYECPEEEVCQRLRELLGQAVQTWMGGDEIGLFLSGGIDSSVLAATVREMDGKVEAFSIGSPDSEDLPKAQEVCGYLGIKHHQRTFSQRDIRQIISKVIYHLETFDLYAVRNGVVNYFLAEMAKEKGIKRVFSGEGGDRLFLDVKEPRGNPLQRLDRVTTAFSLAGYLPYMDRHLVDFVFSLPQGACTKDGLPAKWMLRNAFSKSLPKDILTRKQYKASRGMDFRVLAEYAESLFSDEEFNEQRLLPDGQLIRSKEELWYYRVFKEIFPDNSILAAIERT